MHLQTPLLVNLAISSSRHRLLNLLCPRSDSRCQDARFSGKRWIPRFSPCMGTIHVLSADLGHFDNHAGLQAASQARTRAAILVNQLLLKSLNKRPGRTLRVARHPSRSSDRSSPTWATSRTSGRIASSLAARKTSPAYPPHNPHSRSIQTTKSSSKPSFRRLQLSFNNSSARSSIRSSTASILGSSRIRSQFWIRVTSASAPSDVAHRTCPASHSASPCPGQAVHLISSILSSLNVALPPPAFPPLRSIRTSTRVIQPSFTSTAFDSGS